MMGSDLEAYRRRRDFDRSPEPRGGHRRGASGRLRFVVQKHGARRLHYDLRLELGGVLKSWAVPNGPSLDPGRRRLAVKTEDHPLEYADFEGVIPDRQYGAGPVLVWDRGVWTSAGDPARALADGRLDFELQGDKLRGRFTLVRMRPRPGARRGAENWLLIKRRDRDARRPGEPELVVSRPDSVVSGRDLDAVAAAGGPVRGGEADPAGARADPAPEAAPGARPAPLPQTVRPQLATLVERVPEGEAWFHEPKLDGYRLLCRIDHGRVSLRTRRGNDWTDRFPGIATAAARLRCDTALLDGEAVLFDARGVSDFERLQRGIGRGDPDITLVAFDLLYLDGWDVRGAALSARKQLLRRLVGERPAPATIRYGDHVAGRGGDFFREACRLGLEGVVSKRARDAYLGRRTRSWLKIKCRKRQELVVVGFTDPRGSRIGFGALLLGVRERPGAPLRYAGKVGTGFGDRTLRDVRARLDARRREAPPVAGPPRAIARAARWVEPDLVAEVEFAEWTRDGMLRQPTFRGLRDDKPAGEVVRERPAPAPAAPPRPVRVAGVRLTHPRRVLFPEAGITKLELARYWEEIAALALPHLRDRPLTLYRCPEGRGGECFFQKRIDVGVAEVVPRVPVGKGDSYAAIDALPAVIALVQLGVIELHVWGARRDHLDQPDLIVFDLDPAEGLAWGRVVEAAAELRDRLERLGLAAFVRLTGGKGLHVVVPVVPGPNWTAVKRFARQIAGEMARERPDRFTAVMSKQRRAGKIFIDYLRNAREATAIACYSPRARAGAPVALPIAWEDLDAGAATPPRFRVLDVPELVRRRRDPWRNFESARRPLAG